MRVTYRHEIPIRDDLRQKGITCFLPMVRRSIKKKGKIQQVIEPAVNSLLFIYDSEQSIQAYKNTTPYLQYIMNRTSDKDEKTIVPDRQMQDFINLYNHDQESLQLFTPEQLQLKPGQKVQITSGPLQGLIGTFQRVQGSRNRRFIITLPGLLSAASTKVTPDQLIPLKDDESDAFPRE